MRFEIESKSWFHFLLCQHNASGAIMQVANMSSGAIHLKTNTYNKGQSRPISPHQFQFLEAPLVRQADDESENTVDGED